MNEQSGQISMPEDAAAWYRYPWVWFVFGLPLSAVAFGIVMFVSANYAPDDLVVDNYYKEGMGINKRLKQDENAVTLGAAVRLDGITNEGAVFRVTEGGSKLRLSLYHVSDRRLDLVVALKSVGEGIYTAASEALSQRLREPGIWYIEVTDETLAWRLRQRISTPVTSLEIEG